MCIRDRDNFGLIACPWSEREVFSITPVLAGAGRTGAMIGIGVGLVAFAVLTAGAGTGFLGLGQGLLGSAGATTLTGGATVGVTAASTGFVLGGAASVAIGGIGAALILGGIANAISPSATNAVTNSIERGRNAAKLESFSFSGVVNTAKQGLPVPIAYGRVFVGSAVLSSGLDVDQV